MSADGAFQKYLQELAGYQVFSRAELLRRGWTVTLIAKLLEDPDRLAENPHGRGRGKMNLYRQERVVGAEETPEFRDYPRRKR